MPSSDYPPVNTDNWTQVGVEKKAGVLNLVRDSNEVGEVAVCWFKYRLNENMGPIPANEFIACKLAWLLNLPAAKIQFKDFAGKLGSISFIAASEPYKWAQFPYKASLPAFLNDYDLLSQIIVFDIFINNTDRNQDNLLYSRVQTAGNKYALHLIDHGHSIFGPAAQATEKEVFNFDTHVQIQEFRELFKHGFVYFSQAVEKIKQITNVQIDQIISEVPAEYLSDEQRITVKDMLVHRRDNIYNELESHCKQVGSQ